MGEETCRMQLGPRHILRQIDIEHNLSVFIYVKDYKREVICDLKIKSLTNFL